MPQENENKSRQTSRKKGAAIMYIMTVGIFFLLMTIVFLFFPRSVYSQLEKRDLAEKPDLTKFSENPAKFTSEVSAWFSDTEPYRDELMTLSMGIRGAMKGDFRSEEETVSFRPADVAEASSNTNESESTTPKDISEPSDTQEPTDSQDNSSDLNDGKAKLGSSGTIIIGKGDKVRALMAFGGTPKGGGGYVDLLNELSENFPSQNVYAMVAPLATEFYLPEKAAKASNPQKPFIYSIRDRLSPKVKFVDVYDELLKHKNEDIYLRTDHHWAGLGGYYAAKRLAQTAGVPFKGLDAYERRELKNFVGSMYGYSKDISVKNAPETFVYYVPNQVNYESEFVTYTLNKNFQIIRESRPFKSQFFKKFKDGSGNAYLTFIGTDQAYVKVKTSTPGTRRILIIKDSYGNAVPGNLFYSFNEVHVIDFRYFTHNLKDYVARNGITDIAVCFNVFNAYSNGSASKVKKMINQKGGISIPPASNSSNTSDSKVAGKSTENKIEKVSDKKNQHDESAPEEVKAQEENVDSRTKTEPEPAPVQPVVPDSIK